MPHRGSNENLTQLYQVEWESDELSWCFQGHGQISPSTIRRSIFLIAISLRNPAFSNEWISSVLRDIRYFGGHGVVCLVDTPYLSSIQAQAGTRKEFLENYQRLKTEREQHLQRVRQLVEPHASFTSLLDWNDLITITPKEYNLELLGAFAANGRTTALVLKQVTKVFPDEVDPEKLSQLARFFIEEVPVLVNLYYRLLDGCIDVYPGPQAEFFWALDNGLLHDELPVLSNIAKSGPRHRYGMAIKK